VCVGKNKPILCVLGNCSNKTQCHMQVGLLVKWWITNKINVDSHIGKSHFFQVVHFIKHPPNVMAKLKKDDNFVGLIWVNKLFYAKGFKDVWDSQNWTISSSKRTMKMRSFDLWITMNWRWFMASKFHHIQFSLRICIMLQTCVFQIIIDLCVYPFLDLKYHPKGLNN
jgi:hypothetical protein